MLAVIDYGMGNMSSLTQALRRMDQPFEVTSDPAKVVEAQGLILPGVGAFGDAMTFHRSEVIDLASFFAQEGPASQPCNK